MEVRKKSGPHFFQKRTAQPKGLLSANRRQQPPRFAFIAGCIKTDFLATQEQCSEVKPYDAKRYSHR